VVEAKNEYFGSKKSTQLDEIGKNRTEVFDRPRKKSPKFHCPNLDKFYKPRR
jgi:hypothetical protein